MAQTIDAVEELWTSLVELANAQYESPQYHRLMAVPLTTERARLWEIQLAHFGLNRRDCWPYVQAGAPFAVKQLIWEHEEEELIGDRSTGKLDHYGLAVKQGEALGLTAADFTNTPPTEGSQVCFFAWVHVAQTRPWLGALAASAILEVRNSSELVRGGSMAKRRAEKWAAELGIPIKQQVNNAEHMVADIAHGQLLLDVAREYAATPEDCAAILHGAADSLLIDRVFWGHLADSMSALPL